MTESAMPVNNIGSGQGIATYDPLMTQKPKKRLRDILKSEKRKEKKDGI